MINLPEKLRAVIDNLQRLPSLGEKTAMRHALSMAYWDKSKIIKLGEAILELSNIENCAKCGLFSDSNPCNICLSNERKNLRVICIVESLSDFLAIESSGEFMGTYHVLGGVLNPLAGIGPGELNIDSLVDRIKLEKIKNLILAINPSVEGDATCSYIKHIIPKEVKVERIGFGMPISGSLEYLDKMTISKALENRTQF